MIAGCDRVILLKYCARVLDEDDYESQEQLITIVYDLMKRLENGAADDADTGDFAEIFRRSPEYAIDELFQAVNGIAKRLRRLEDK